MDHLNFLYCLQGFAELSGNTPPTAEQWKSIREHLALCFTKVTPPLSVPVGPSPMVGPAGPVTYPPLKWPEPRPSWPNIDRVTITC